MHIIFLMLSCMHTIEVKHGPKVHCPLTEAFPEGPAWFAEYDVNGKCLLTQQVSIRNNGVTLPVIQLVGEGALSFPGSPVLPVAWSNFHCDAVEAPPTREVCGRIAGNLRQELAVRVWDGERVAVNTTARSGEFCVRADGEQLDVEATRFDGHLLVAERGSWNPSSGADVALSMPAKVQGGIGVFVESVSEGRFRVIRAVDRMPAAVAGIAPGMEILVEDARTGDIGSPIIVHIVEGDVAKAVELSRELFVDNPAREDVLLPGDVLMMTSSQAGIVL